MAWEDSMSIYTNSKYKKDQFDYIQDKYESVLQNILDNRKFVVLQKEDDMYKIIESLDGYLMTTHLIYKYSALNNVYIEGKSVYTTVDMLNLFLEFIESVKDIKTIKIVLKGKVIEKI